MHKLNRHTAVEFLAHPADSLARHIRVGCGATVTICRNYRLANLLVVERRASKSRGAMHKLNRHTAVESLAHPARFERAVPAFGPGAIRTRSPRLRRAMLYPVEPRVLTGTYYKYAPYKMQFILSFGRVANMPT